MNSSRFRSFLAVVMLAGSSFSRADDNSLIENWSLLPTRSNSNVPTGFTIAGDAEYGDSSKSSEQAGWGIGISSSEDLNKDGEHSAVISTRVSGLTPEDGRWFRFQIRARAEDGFQVEQDGLYLNVEFFKEEGKSSLDHIQKPIYAYVQRYREDLKDAGTNKTLGTSTWNIYSIEFRTPFPEVDTMDLSVGLHHGSGQGDKSHFFISEIELIRITPPTAFSHLEETKASAEVTVDLTKLVSLGGRWYFDPQGGDTKIPRQFDHTNADQLIYLAERPVAPFAGNMSSWLKAGYLSRNGQLVKRDQFVEDSQVIQVTKTHLVIRSKNLPNHPTAVFPDRWRSLDGNPNYIQEQDNTWYLPLEPRENPDHKAMQDENNNDYALPMGPIGLALNGVVFFNPFDHLQNEDAVWRLDRCCGHPAPNSMYHYHKYPVCVKSPWTDDGESHSPLIGFAFDGYPVYGPYESTRVLAKDLKTNPLNEFNIHQDEDRGWHYHVTPGKFPHIIGGYWGVMETRNQQRRPPPGRGGPPPGGRPGPPGRPPFGQPPPR